MDILIKNIAMPKGDIPLVLIIASDGTVEEIDDSDEINATDAKAIEISPHGKLCEKEAVWDMLHGICVKCNENKDNERHISCIWCKIKDAMGSVYGSRIPTVLEANYGTDN